MKILRKLLDKQEQMFAKGKPLERFYPAFEAGDTFLFTASKVNKNAPFVRDSIDLKRLMIMVFIALGPCALMAMLNTGYQANLALSGMGSDIQTWRIVIVKAICGTMSYTNPWSNLIHGLLYFLPVMFVTFAVGGVWEMIFAIVRKHEINEGFLVTGLLFPLILPPTIPLWQVAVAISFGVVIGKEVFGGTGYNILNPALTARAFLFFAYPVQISGDAVWVAVDGFTAATPLATVAESGLGALTPNLSWMTAFLGFTPGSMGETSVLACLLGALILIACRIGSWRIMLSVAIGTICGAYLLNAVGSDTNPMFAMPFWWHMVLGGWAFGAIFMATDPVSAPCSNTGRWIYGWLIGFICVLVRVVNPAYPEGMMLTILLLNVFAPLIDHYVVQHHIRKRKARYG